MAILVRPKHLRHLLYRNPNSAAVGLLLLPLSRHFCDASSLRPNSSPSSDARSRTPLEKQFDSWVDRLRPGFTSNDVAEAIRAQSDSDLALDLFRWTALRPGYRHDGPAYLAMLQVAVFNHRYSQAEILQRRGSSNSSSNAPACRPSIETYSMLLAAVLRRIGKPPVSYVYLHSVRSLARQMKSSGVIPDTFALNLIIKAYARCLEMEEAIRVFREMGLYGCEPNEYSYGYIVQGLCQKGWLEKALNYFKEMRSKALVPTATIYMAVICSLSLERRLEAAVEVVFDMLDNRKAPDILTYRTLLEEMCREGRSEVAYDLLEELRQRKGAMKGRMHSDLLASLHWVCQPRH
ncbi:hypothetical protein ZIOFF_016011 [Zingiber officinale]|uniref:Pentatricopeptide repeat-containing protein n=1 Tax=Zingiber officinale TaxID=94328 RepID=A0A8J5LWZ6_ZINOF|nr:hypothetical protein ZIOFF_016011 [Zingiber officinale]